MSDRNTPNDEVDPEVEQAEYLAQNDLADPETLEPGADFRAYLKDGVPDLLRRRALRALWRSNPVLANIDGLVDYGDDFTDAAMVPDLLATVYQVGKGMVDRTLNAEGEADREGEGVDIPPDSTDHGRRAEVSILAEDDQLPTAAHPDNEVISEGLGEQAPLPRRMQFRFES